MDKKIPFAPPRIDQAVIDEVTETLLSGWITTGPRTKELERLVAEMCQVPKVLCVNSATAGLTLMMAWWGVSKGDEVIVPAYTYCATANVVMHLGARPVMVDIDPSDGCISIDAIRKAITPNTKAIIPVDLAGLPVNYPALQQLLEEPEIKAIFRPKNYKQKLLGRPLILADAAHSLGATVGDKPAATYSDFTVFSFHAVKNLTTAEGGAICLNLPTPFENDQLYQELNITTLHGQTKDAMAKFKKSSWEYDVMHAGYKCNMPDVLAAIGLVGARRYISDTLPQRRAICQRYTELLSGYSWAELPVFEDDYRHSSAHLYLLRIKGINETVRNKIIQHLYDADVSVNVHYKPLPMLTVYRNAGYSMESYPLSQDFYEREITLPVFYNITPEQQQRVVEVLVEAVETEIGKS